MVDQNTPQLVWHDRENETREDGVVVLGVPQMGARLLEALGPLPVLDGSEKIGTLRPKGMTMLVAERHPLIILENESRWTLTLERIERIDQLPLSGDESKPLPRWIAYGHGDRRPLSGDLRRLAKADLILGGMLIEMLEEAADESLSDGDVEEGAFTSKDFRDAILALQRALAQA